MKRKEKWTKRSITSYRSMIMILGLLLFSNNSNSQCIANMSPNSATQGETGLSITINLGAGAPTGETPYLVRLDSIVGTDIELNGTALTATFSFPQDETTGAKTLILEFPTSVCTLTSTFTLNAGTFSGTVYYVDPSIGGTPPYAGTSWGTAFPDLNMAINEVNMAGGGEIWVKEGTYTRDASDRSLSFNMRNGVFLYGGFDGTETVRSQRDYANDSTILSGDIGTTGDSTDNTYHILIGDNNALLDGFFITGGQADGEFSNRLGGGLYNYDVAPLIKNCVFYNNYAEEGGAMYSIDEDAISIVSSCVFKNNNANKGGAMVCRVGAHTYIDSCTFTNNNAEWRAGAIFIDYGADPIIIHTTISNNTCPDGNGGAIYVDNISSQLNSTAPTFKDVVFTNNSSLYRGGAISFYNSSTNPVIYNCSFSTNSCGEGGGAIAIDWNPKVILKGISFSGNTGGTGNADVDNNGGQITNY